MSRAPEFQFEYALCLSVLLAFAAYLLVMAL
jgi:hypothetical protein